MIKRKHSPEPTHKKQSHLFSLTLVIPLTSCIVSSLIGIVIGQIGNFFYLLTGNAANCLVIPGFMILFLISFGMSFFSSQLLKKWLVKAGK
ncbi:MAG: hypothetical protein DDG59_10855 [Anaerolineae bacterium]|jgi:hypothetical protein|nr:MAG: hypothetical protein DDG59_10855 [Anaerolineae bacterium]